jgi:hypothetical protein
MVVATGNIPGRRLKILRIACPIFLSLFFQDATQRYKVIKNGLPSDAKIVDVQLSRAPYTDSIDVRVESDTYELVPFGAEIPFVDTPIVEKI